MPDSHWLGQEVCWGQREDMTHPHVGFRTLPVLNRSMMSAHSPRRLMESIDTLRADFFSAAVSLTVSQTCRDLTGPALGPCI